MPGAALGDEVTGGEVPRTFGAFHSSDGGLHQLVGGPGTPGHPDEVFDTSAALRTGRLCLPRGPPVQVAAIGPFAMTYVNPADDPSKTAAVTK
jgi:hypothetical protein